MSEAIAAHPAATGAERVERLLAQLTLEEKAALTVGRDAWTTQPVARLGIPSVWLSDGPTGLRKVKAVEKMTIDDNVPATCFPTASALGSTWDPVLVSQVGQAIAAEAQAENVQVLLAPGLNLKRSPLCGRNFEYFSEDPVLTGELAAAYVNGLQAGGVGGCLKHLVANESETDRMITSSEVDERPLRELYLRAFEIAIARSNPWTIMCAYNRLNGVYCAENPWLLRDIVAGEWGYQGVIMSDWFAVNDRAAGVAAGLHLQMPAAPTAGHVVAAVRAGHLAEGQLDDIVRSLLRFIFKADAARQPGRPVDFDAHHALARRVAAASAVLLKNEGGLLPLADDRPQRVAVIGDFARTPRYQGAGSSQVTPVRPVENIYDELTRWRGPGAIAGFAPGYWQDGSSDTELLSQAQRLAQQADVAVVVVGLPAAYEEEGADRKHIDLPTGHTRLVEAVLAVQPNAVVVLVNGSAVSMPWVSRVPAILEGWLGGQASGGGIVDVLTGQVNPAGRLAETFPNRLADTPAFLSFPEDGTGRVIFTEGLYTGYRWYEARHIEPLFPFGHGLSYTTFEYSDLAVAPSSAGAGAPMEVSVRVRNTGGRAGDEVVQLYVREPEPLLPRPDKELKAFARVSLAAGAETIVRLTLSSRDFAFYDPRSPGWVVSGGAYTVLVGASSRDIRLQTTVTVAASGSGRAIFSRLTPHREWLRDPVARAAVRPKLSRLFRLFGQEMPPNEAEDASGPINSFIGDMPISKLIMFGVMSSHELDELIATVNRG